MTNAVVGQIESFSEDDSLWIRRRNATSGDAAYQLAGLSFEVIPEPASLVLVGIVSAVMLAARRLFRI